jgi:hypothetical protein
MAMESIQPLTEMSTRNISWGLKAAGVSGSQTYHLRVSTVWKSESLKPPGTLRACPGLYRNFYLYHYLEGFEPCTVQPLV